MMLFSALVLIGCGGGSAVSSSPSIGGTVAVGFAIVGGTVDVKCASAAAIAPSTTSTTGALQVDLTGKTLPCAIEVTGGTINSAANTTAYHSIAMAAGNVNVTPLTDLLIANLAAPTSPSAWYAALTPAALAAITTTQVSTAMTNVKTALGLTTQLSGVDLITTPFTPTRNNVMDNTLEAFQSALTTNSNTHASLLSLAGASAGAPFTPPSGFNTALNTAYSTSSTGSNGGGASTTPTLTSFTPTSGAVSATVVITGTNLMGVTQVLFTGPSPSNAFVAGVISAQTATSITTIVPASLTAGGYTISVVFTGGETAATGSFTATAGTGGTGGGTNSNLIGTTTVYGACAAGYGYNPTSPNGCLIKTSSGGTGGVGWSWSSRNGFVCTAATPTATNTGSSLAVAWTAVDLASNYTVHSTQNDGISTVARSSSTLSFNSTGDLSTTGISITDTVSTTGMTYTYAVTANSGAMSLCSFPATSTLVGVLPTSTNTALTFSAPSPSSANPWPSAATLGSVTAYVLDSQIMRSTDGTTWTKLTPNTGALGNNDKIAASGTTFVTAVAAATGVKIAHSADANTWTAGATIVAPSGADTTSFKTVAGLTYTGGKFYLAMIYNASPAFGLMALYASSDDGVTWARVGGTITGASYQYGYPTHIAANGNTIFIFTGGGLRALVRSTDGGTTWTTVPTLDGLPAVSGYSNETRITGIVNGLFQGEQVVSAGSSSSIVRFYSADGLTWTRTTGNGSYVLEPSSARSCSYTNSTTSSYTFSFKSDALALTSNGQMYVACPAGVVSTTDGMDWRYITRTSIAGFEPLVFSVRGTSSAATIQMYGRTLPSGVGSSTPTFISVP